MELHGAASAMNSLTVSPGTRATPRQGAPPRGGGVQGEGPRGATLAVPDALGIGLVFSKNSFSQLLMRLMLEDQSQGGSQPGQLSEILIKNFKRAGGVAQR